MLRVRWEKISAKDNVVLDETHHALLTDFGLSKEPAPQLGVLLRVIQVVVVKVCYVGRDSLVSMVNLIVSHRGRCPITNPLTSKTQEARILQILTDLFKILTVCRGQN